MSEKSCSSNSVVTQEVTRNPQSFPSWMVRFRFVKITMIVCKRAELQSFKYFFNSIEHFQQVLKFVETKFHEMERKVDLFKYDKDKSTISAEKSLKIHDFIFVSNLNFQLILWSNKMMKNCYKFREEANLLISSTIHPRSLLCKLFVTKANNLNTCKGFFVILRTFRSACYVETITTMWTFRLKSSSNDPSVYFMYY